MVWLFTPLSEWLCVVVVVVIVVVVVVVVVAALLTDPQFFTISR